MITAPGGSRIQEQRNRWEWGWPAAWGNVTESQTEVNKEDIEVVPEEARFGGGPRQRFCDFVQHSNYDLRLNRNT